MFEANNITKSYRNKRVLNSISVSLSRGEIAGILGPNGAGKTTLFKIMTGLLRPDDGKVIMDGEEVTGLHLHQLIRKGVGYLPQEPSLFTGLTVYENLKIVSEMNGNDIKSSDRLNNVMSTMNLYEIKNNIAENLSGGEKRRLEVARALILNPKYMLFDEPFSQIDPKTVYELISIIRKMKEENIGILITDHSAREGFGVCDRIFIVADGRVIIEGKPSELKNNNLVKEIYLGQLFEV